MISLQHHMHRLIWRWSSTTLGILLLAITMLDAVEVQAPSSSITGPSLNVPFGASYSQARVQSIYLASEIGTTGKIRSLTVNFTSLPGRVLTNCTIRLKHTALASFSSATWETGFTQVFQGNATVSSTGNYTFIFTTPFNYTGGSNNLMVDISFRNASIDTVNGNLSYSTPAGGANRSMYYRDNSAAVDPLTWSGASPAGIFGSWVPNIYLGISSRLYVRPSAVGRGNGIDWNNALGSISTALANSSSGDDIWVAAGTYKPGSARTSTFQLKNGVSLYGGFTGSEAFLSQRAVSNQTVLSGDIGAIGTFTDNCYHVVTGATGGLIDGFVIRDGFANATDFGVNSGGGGVLCHNTSPTIRNCVFTSNNAWYAGGAIFIANNATATIENCVFTGNGGVGGITCQYGGAIEDEGGQSPVIRNCTFSNNVGTQGGAIEIVGGGTTSMIDCVLWGNDSVGPEFYNNGKTVYFAGNTIKNGIAQFTQPSGSPSNGGGNDALDPLFFNTGDVDGPDNLFGTSDDGLTLMPPSPAIDGGVGSGPSLDLVGRKRNVGGGSDRGAYETPILYVSALAEGSQTGNSWKNAFAQLNEGIDNAPAGPIEIWVRAGTYKPTTGSDRNRSFALRRGMALYGGFGGLESSRNQRDWRMRSTTLSGDVGTIGVTGDNSYHVVRASSGLAVLDGFIIRDGVANQNSSNNERGAGLYAQGEIEVRRCVFTANTAYYGGGIFSDGGKAIIEETMFLANQAGGSSYVIGGGMYLAYGVGSQINNCVFWRNTALGSPYGGGAFFVESSSAMSLINNTFVENSASAGGGGVEFYSTTATVQNSIFWGNTTASVSNQITTTSGGSNSVVECLIQGGLPAGSSDGGGLQTTNPQFLDVESPLGADNIPGTGDDGLTLRLSSPAINQGIATGVSVNDLAGNLRFVGAAVDLGAYERLNVIYVDGDAGGADNGSSWANAFRSLRQALQGAVSRRDEIWVAEGTYHPSTNDQKMSFELKARVGVYGGFASGETILTQRSLGIRRVILSGDIDQNLSLSGNSAHVVVGATGAILDGVTITGGYADGNIGVSTNDGGGALLDEGTSTTLVNCILADNEASKRGGAVYALNGGMSQFRGCVFTRNRAEYGGGFYAYEASINVVNSTFSGNQAGNYGGSGYIDGGQGVVTNTIMYYESLPALYVQDSQVWVAASDIQGSGGSGSWDPSHGVDAGSNIDKEPKFVKDSDPAGSDGIYGTDDDGLRLYGGSPCLDGGARAGGPNLDLLGAVRPSGSAPDIGAYEGKVVSVDFQTNSASGAESVTAPSIIVQLSEASDLPVTVTYARASGGSAGTATLGDDFTLGSLTLVFNPGETTKALNLTVSDDLVQEANETIGFVFTGVTNARINGTTLHTYTIINNDTAGITTSPTVLVLNESGAPTSGNVTLSLASTPAAGASVSVVVTSSAPTEARLSHGAATNQSQVTVTWSSGDYGAKVVSVSSVDDLIDDGDFALSVTTAPATSADPFYNGKDAPDVSVTVVDNETVGLVLSKTTVAVTEANVAATDSFTVRLASQPTGPVTVQVTSSNPADATVSVSSLNFGVNTGAGGWDTAQTVTVTAINDQVDEPGSDSVAFAVNLDANSAIDLKYDVLTRTVTGTLTDNDAAGITITPSAAQTPAENGGTVVYSVVLTSKPTATVTIGSIGNLIRSSDTAEGTVSTTTLTFGTNNGPGGWDAPQTITVSAVDDFVAGANTPYNLIIPAATSSDPKYSNLFGATRSLTNTDNDTVGIVLSPTSGLVTTEVGGTATFTARLNSQPTGVNAVVFTLTALQAGGAHQGELSLNGGSTYAGAGGSLTLTFTATNNAPVVTGTSVTAGWNQPVTVTIRGLDDPGNTASQVYFISRSAATSGDSAYNLAINNTAVQVTNQSQDAAGVTVSPTALSVTEAAGATHSANFTVKLAKQPLNTVNIALAFSTNTGQATLSTTALSFSTSGGVAGGWDQPQIVTVTAMDDGVDDGDLTTDIAFTVTSADGDYHNLAVATLPVTCVDNDVRGIAVTPVSGLTTTEAGGQAIFVVYLTSQPTGGGNVSFDLTTSDASEGLVRLGSSGPGAASVNVSFSAGDWNIPKVVSVVGQEDAIDDGAVAYAISFSNLVTAGAGDYQTTPPTLPGTVSVVNQDDDTARVLLSRTSITLDEDATPTDTYTIVLGSEPTGNVTVALDPGSQATVDDNSITFTPLTWNTPILVTVTVVDDVVAEGTHNSIITHAASSTDPIYQGIAVNDLTVVITDDDVAGVTPNPTGLSALTTFEATGGAAPSLSYVLTTQPRGNVTVLLSSSDPTEAMPVPDRLTFTSSDYNDAAAHTVVIRGVDDSVADGDQGFTISATVISADGAYNGFSVAQVGGTNTDDDVVGVIFTPTTAMAPLITSESGTTVAFTVRLASQPLANVSLPIASANTAEGRVAVSEPLTLNFTPVNWNSDQIVTVTGQRDFVDEATATTVYQVTLGPTGGVGSGYTGSVSYNGVVGATGSVHLENTDIDQAGVQITPTTGLVTGEGGATANYNIVLTSKPADTVRIAIGPGAPAQLAAVASVDFTPTDWDVPQTITVSAVDDDIAEGTPGTPHTGTLTHTISFPNSVDPIYQALGALNSVTALITDDDTPGIVIAATDPPETHENPLDLQAISVFTVNLQSEPTSTVRLTVTSADPGEVLLALDGVRATATPSVTIDILAADWDSLTPPEVTAFGINDDVDDGDQLVNVTLSIVDVDTADTRYQAVSDVVRQITNHDKDTANVTIVESSHGVNFPALPSDLSENDPATPYTYTLVLDSEPTGNVTISLSEGVQVNLDADPGTAGNQSSVIFTPTRDQPVTGNTAGWNVPITVTVTPVDDFAAETSPHSATIVHAASGGGYTGVSVGSVVVSIGDNDASTPPVVALPGADPFAYDENGHLARVIDATATVNDADSPNFHSGNITLAISAGVVVGEDVLGVNHQGTAAGEIGVVAGVVTYNPLANTGAVQIATITGGTAGDPLVIALSATVPADVSVEAVQALVRQLTYRNTSLDPALTTRTLTLTVNDGDGGTSTPVTKDITITPFNDPPVVPDQAIVTVVDQPVSGTLAGSDPEGGMATFALVGAPPINGTLVLNADGTYLYTPLGGDFANTYTFQVEATDPSANTSPVATVTIHITGGDEARPQLISAPPIETDLGGQFAVLVFDPGSKGGTTAYSYRVVDLPAGDLTATVISLSNTPTSVTAQVNWTITSGSPTAGDHFTFGVIVTDLDNNTATYVPVTVQFVQPNGPG